MTGAITLGDLYRVWPFGNEVELVRITGRTLINMLEHSVSAYNPEDPKGSFLQVSGKYES